MLAYMWWNLAAAQGDAAVATVSATGLVTSVQGGAQENKDRAEEIMTRAQIAEGQRLSREWLEAHPPGGN